MSTSDPQLAELLLKHRDDALAQVTGVREDGEPRRAAGRVLEHAVAVAIAQTRCCQELPGALAIHLACGRGGRVPASIAGRDRPVQRCRGAQVDGIDDRLTIDSARNRLSEFLARHPGRPARGEPRRPQVEREEVGIKRDADIEHSQTPLVGEPF